ncbi:MAG TPA: hypothetical protein VGF24_14795 [Vicinamibacterales bacterium]
MAVQEIAQAAEGAVPVAAVLLGPLCHLADRYGIQLADLLSTIAARPNEIRALEIGQMLGDGLL